MKAVPHLGGVSRPGASCFTNNDDNNCKGWKTFRNLFFRMQYMLIGRMENNYIFFGFTKSVIDLSLIHI